MTNYNFPNQVLKALTLLEQNNYEAVVVGGAVRDLFLNKEPHDYDIATNATVEEMYEIFNNKLKELNSDAFSAEKEIDIPEDS